VARWRRRRQGSSSSPRKKVSDRADDRPAPVDFCRVPACHPSSAPYVQTKTCRMGQELRPWRLRYAAAIVATVVAVVLQLAIWPYLPPSPHLLFYPAILAVAWFGGFG